MLKSSLKTLPACLLAVLLAVCSFFSPLFTPLAGAKADSPVVNFNCNAQEFKVQIAPIITNELPGYSLNQAAANCMAWQTFIALNWKADRNHPGEPDTNVTAEKFGDPETPGDISPVVWETYKEASEVIDPSQATGWESPQALPASFLQFKNAQSFTPTSNFGFKALTATSKFTDGPEFELDEVIQAFTKSWLTAQNHSLTFYEIRLNKDEYQYITENTLAVPQRQEDCATGSAGLSLPSGTAKNNQDKNCHNATAHYGFDGAIEIKAAWVELKDSNLYPKYKIARSIIKGPNDSEPREAVMGLVGLHIIHKVPNAQQLVWATFEHIDNAPSEDDIDSGLKESYMYYNPSCDSGSDRYDCENNYQPKKEDPYDAPIQVVRLNSIPASSRNLNNAVWSTLEEVNDDSVFQNYQLIDTMWPASSQAVDPGATTPLPNGNIQSGAYNNYVANTTMETYFQQPQQQPDLESLFTPGGCLGCHVLAPIASSKKAGLKARIPLTLPSGIQSNSSSKLASDYSFVFSQAQANSNYPKANPEP